MIWVEPVGPLARLPGKNRIKYFSNLNGFNRLNRLNWLNWLNRPTKIVIDYF